MSPIDFHLSMPYHYITKVHFPAHSSKSLFLFYVFLYSLLKTAFAFSMMILKPSKLMNS